MTHDNDLRGVFDLALADEPACKSDTSAVFAEAGRIRTRRRLAIGASGVGTAVVVLGLVLAASAYGLPGRGSSHAGQIGLTVGAPAASVPAKPSITHSAQPASTPDIPAAEMVAILTSLIPAGFVTSGPVSQPGYAGLVLTDASGKAKIEINVQPINSVQPAPHTTDSGLYDCKTRPMAPGSTCATTQLPDGTIVLTTDGPSDESSVPHAVERIVDTLRPDGLRVVVAQWNSVDEKRGAVTRSSLALSLAQMQAIAMNPEWVR